MKNCDLEGMSAVEPASLFLIISIQFLEVEGY